jgi:lipoprotein-anchoring transpeptidase ErfK/SrfK
MPATGVRRALSVQSASTMLIGRAVSNGCIRRTNDNIIEVYDRTPLGTKVIVI